MPVCSTLLTEYASAQQVDWLAAELAWLAFTGYDVSARTLNLVVDEAEESFAHLSPLMSSVVHTTCHGGSCNTDVSVHRSPMPMLV